MRQHQEQTDPDERPRGDPIHPGPVIRSHDAGDRDRDLLRHDCPGSSGTTGMPYRDAAGHCFNLPVSMQFDVRPPAAPCHAKRYSNIRFIGN